MDCHTTLRHGRDRHERSSAAAATSTRSRSSTTGPRSRRTSRRIRTAGLGALDGRRDQDARSPTGVSRNGRKLLPFMPYWPLREDAGERSRRDRRVPALDSAARARDAAASGIVFDRSRRTTARCVEHRAVFFWLASDVRHRDVRRRYGDQRGASMRSRHSARSDPCSCPRASRLPGCTTGSTIEIDETFDADEPRQEFAERGSRTRRTREPLRSAAPSSSSQPAFRARR